MVQNVFSDFYNKLSGTEYPAPKVQSDKKQKNSKAKYIIPSAIAGAGIGGGSTYYKQQKNLNMKYAVFAKNELKKIMSPQIDAKYRFINVTRFTKNPITHIKDIIGSIKCLEEDIAAAKSETIKNKILLQKLILQKALLEHKQRILDINFAFKQNYFKNLIPKTTKSIVFGTTAGIILSISLLKIFKKSKDNNL